MTKARIWKMMNEVINLTPVINAAIALIAAIITAFLIPWIKANTTAKQREQMMVWVEIAVNAAEQLYKGSGRGAEKKEYVMQFLEDKGYTADLNEIEAAIEAFVLQFNIDS